jgi:hypothetical protein
MAVEVVGWLFGIAPNGIRLNEVVADSKNNHHKHKNTLRIMSTDNKNTQTQQSCLTDVMQSVILPNELRFGIYLQEIGTDEIFQVEDAFFTLLELNLQISKPIPLTEEWLLKLGFQTGGAKQYLFINLDEKDKCYLYFNPFGKGIAIDQNEKECSFEIELNYVHQLQNLYFSLTNRELTVA